MEIDKRTRRWRPEDDEKATLGFQIVHVYFPEVGDSVVGVLCMPGVLASKAAPRVSWLAD